MLDDCLLSQAELVLRERRKVSLSFPIVNTDRSVGAMLSGEIARKYGHEGLPEQTLDVRFEGSAGQSFGAFLVHGVHFRLEGDANDYLGKGLSGGRISLMPPSQADFRPEENIIAGNTLLYGATSGEVYINGARAAIVGNICMDICMVDVTEISCNEGDRVEIFGEHIPVEEIAGKLDTISYEILTSVSTRVKRVYYRE